MNDLQDIQDLLEATKDRLELAILDADKMRVDLAHELARVGTNLVKITRQLSEMRDHYGV